ncbi:Centrosomal protein of 70 kDa [Plasmodiophora brassicae]|nr:hypothetical protein PBRA_004680 [Plasmodiophora brassicae]
MWMFKLGGGCRKQKCQAAPGAKVSRVDRGRPGLAIFWDWLSCVGMAADTTTADIDQLLKDTDQFLNQHSLQASKASVDGGTAGTAAVGPDDQVDRLLRDTDSLLREIDLQSASRRQPAASPTSSSASGDDTIDHHVDNLLKRSAAVLVDDDKGAAAPSSSSDIDALKRTSRILNTNASSESDNDIPILRSEVESRPRLINLDRGSPGISSSDLPVVNRLLARCGFSNIDNENQALRTLLSVLTQYEVKSDQLHSMTEQQNREKAYGGPATSQQTEFLESANRTLNYKLQESQKTIEKLTASLQQHQGQSSPAPDDELKRLRTKNTSLKAKVAQIEHELRRKETLVEEMQSKLQKISAKEDARREHETELFKEIFAKGPRASSLKDSRTLELLGAFDAQRKRMQEEIDALTRKCEALSPSVHSADAQMQVQTLRDEIARLKDELERRPSVRQWQDAQNEMKALRAQLAEARSVGDFRQKLSTRELIERDRDIHRLTLGKIEHIPQPICVEILQDVCRLLEVDDVALILPSLKKVCKAVSRIPLLQSFVRDVLALVGIDADNEGDPYIAIKRTVPILTSWKEDMKTLAKLEAFKRDLWHRIQQRRSALIQDRTPEVPSTSQPLETQMTTILSSLDELIATEATLLDGKKAFENLEEFVQARPDILCNKIVGHFMQLFSVDSIEGVLPAMSKLCVDIESAHNFMNAIRSTLRLDSNASVSAIIAQVQRLADNVPSSTDRSQEPDFQSADALIQLRQLLHVQTTSQIVEACRKLADRCALYDGLFPHVDRVLNRLFTILRVHHIDDIVPAVQRLSVH